MRRGWMPATLLPLLAVLYYILSLGMTAPGITAGDAPELVAASATLGSAHAPGYPLYVLLGHLFLSTPVGTAAFRVTLLSVISQTIAFIALSLLLNRYLKSRFPGREMAGFSTLTAFFLMISPLCWYQVTGPEVYSLHLLFVVFIASMLLEPTLKSLRLAAFVFGLALAHHHMIFLLLPALLWAYKGFIKRPKFLALCVSLTMTGLSLYLFLPIRAIRSPDVNWGNPSTWNQFLYHVARGQYGGNLKGGNWLNGLTDTWMYLQYLLKESWGIGLLLALIALWLGRKALHGPLLTAFLCTTFILPLLIHIPAETENSRIMESFFPPMLALLGPWIAEGAVQTVGWMRSNALRYSMAVLLILIVVIRAPFSYRLTDNSRNLAAEDNARNVLLCLPKDSVLYSEGDTATFPLAYLKFVLGLRPDTEVFDRTGGLFEDLYGLLRADLKGRGLPFDEMVRIELSHETRHPHPAVFYSEKETVPGRPLEYAGLLFKVSGQAGPTGPDNVPLPDFPAWAHMRPPRIGQNHDYLNREDGSRFFLMKGEYLMRRDEEQAQVALATACRIAFDNARVFLNAGVALLNAGRLPEADRYFAQAVDLEPLMPLAWYDWGYSADRLGDHVAAQTRYLRTLELDPGYLDARNNLAYLYMRRQKVEQAVAQWEEILRRDPRYRRAYRDLGLVLIHTQPGRGRELLQHYLQMGPPPQEVEFIRKVLADSIR